MAATIGRLLGTSARRAAVNGLKTSVPHNGVSVIRAPKPLACIAAQKACFSISAARWAPAVTQKAPHFKGTAVLNGEFKEISLEDFRANTCTFVCPTEIIAFSDKANEFRDINCNVVGVSVDSHFTHLAWTNTPRKSGGLGKIHIPLLADLTKQVSRDYGVLLEGPGIALRGLFIIDPNGVVRHMSVNDLPVGRSVEETLRLVKAFQFVETHGEVCPASWTPKSPTIKPTPDGSKEYFEKVN
ncbi:thioredoxin-dependent peroxide mitochondrial [Labeo rohita]|uniref:Thioredoxin-dependent peroxide reductase, mitochondrial n=1 Tax=Labeo rohita TaxID=84645 RepID=A0A498N9C9_LABRO|nr:thioredoxin-dependent peroxide mitochondrial [Labeo rohita]